MDYFRLCALIGLITVIFLWIRWRRKRFALFSDRGIPGPKPNFFVGNLKQLRDLRDDFDYEYSKKYGKLFGYFAGAIPMMSVTDPDLIKMIQVKDFKSFTNKDPLIRDGGVPDPILAKGIILCENEDWRRTRSILSSSFTTVKIKKMSPIILNATDIFLDKLMEKSKSKDVFDISIYYQELLLDITSKAAFGINTGVQHGEQSTFLESMKIALSADISHTLVVISACFPEIEPIPTKLRQLIDVFKYVVGLPSIRMIFRSCQEIIEQRKKSDNKRDDLLQAMIEGKIDMKRLQNIKDEELVATKEAFKEEKATGQDANTIKLTVDEIKANAMSFMIAGYETTSTTLTYITYFLTTYPEIQEKVRQEIKEKLGGKKEVDYNDLAEMVYLEQVIFETLRIFPPGPLGTNRRNEREFTFKGITIPKGVIFSVPHRALHRNPENWPDPLKFMPERFSPENRSNINGTNFQPFGNGPRNCMGMKFALTAMKFVLTRLLSEYRLEKASTAELEFTFSAIFTKPNEVLVRTALLED